MVRGSGNDGENEPFFPRGNLEQAKIMAQKFTTYEGRVKFWRWYNGDNSIRFTIETILAYKVQVNNVLFLVHWVNSPPEFDSWVPFCELQHVPLLVSFLEQNSEAFVACQCLLRFKSTQRVADFVTDVLVKKTAAAAGSKQKRGHKKRKETFPLRRSLRQEQRRQEQRRQRQRRNTEESGTDSDSTKMGYSDADYMEEIDTLMASLPPILDLDIETFVGVLDVSVELFNATHSTELELESNTYTIDENGVIVLD